MKEPRKPNVWKVLLIGILVLGLWLRTIGVNWDEYQHLNPDERFLTMVLSAMKWPGVVDYFKTSVSTLNPVNVGYGFFVYGTFPIFLNKLVAGILGLGDYNGYLIVGRVLSAIFDTATIFVVFLLGREIASNPKLQTTNHNEAPVGQVANFNERFRGLKTLGFIGIWDLGFGIWKADLVGLVAAFFYAVAVIPIQNSHFFIVDTFGNFFGALGIYLLLRFVNNPRPKMALCLGTALGLALACKLSLLLLTPVVGIAFLLVLIRHFDVSIHESKSRWRLLLALLFFCASAYLSFRVFMPYAFQDNSLLRLEKRFVENSSLVSKMVRGEIDMPPSIQWARTNFIWPIQELTVWGWGLPVGVVMALALGWAGSKALKTRSAKIFLLLCALVIPFSYQASLLAKAQRYFFGAYPILAVVVAAWFVDIRKKKYSRLLFVIAGVGAFSWAIAFTNIYRVSHSRVAASRWIYANLPKGSRVGWEHWDDPLPLLVDGHGGGEYPGVQMTLYDPDTPEKLDKLISDLNEADYVILSSNRLWGSIPKMPERYPMATEYYQLLFAEKLGFIKVVEFSSYPRLGRWIINDDRAEEPFTVYDHPKVLVYKKTDEFSVGKARAILSGIDFSKVKFRLPKDL